MRSLAVPYAFGGAVATSFWGVPRTTQDADLIVLKMAFHRQKDLQDVKGMLHIQRGQLDMPYLRQWSTMMLEPLVARELDELIATYDADSPPDSSA